MSWLLFLDESGHDHRNMPYEVRGGIALHTGQLWPFVRAIQRLELDCFGCQLQQFGGEFKGSTLLDRKRFRFAQQSKVMEPATRQKHCRAFLTKGLEKKPPSRSEFTAYGQACLEMARGIFELLRDHDAVIIAGAIPRGSRPPPGLQEPEFLRKDYVFILERYFYFLDSKKEHGLLVIDEVDKSIDRKLIRCLEAYFSRTAAGRYRTSWIVPSPFFVASDMTYPVQAADLCIYCINWGFRLAGQGMDSTTRSEIAYEFGPWLNRLQFRGKGTRDGNAFESFGICFIPNPFGAGRA